MPKYLTVRKVLITVLVIGLTVTALTTGFVRIRGWDWTVGSNNAYCYVYVPHVDAGCENAG